MILVTVIPHHTATFAVYHLFTALLLNLLSTYVRSQTKKALKQIKLFGFTTTTILIKRLKTLIYLIIITSLSNKDISYSLLPHITSK